MQLQFAKRACAVDFSTAQLQRCVRSSILYACERTVRCRLAHDAADPRLLNRRIRSLTGQKLGGLFSCGQDMWLRPARSVCISSHPFAGPLLPRKLQMCGRGDAVAFAPAANDCSRGHLCFRPEIFEPQTSSFVVTWHPFLPPYMHQCCVESGVWTTRSGGLVDLVYHVTTCFPARSIFPSMCAASNMSSGFKSL